MPDSMEAPFGFSDEEWIDFCARCAARGIEPLPENGILDAIIELTIAEQLELRAEGA